MSQYPQYIVPAGLINLGVGQPSPKMLPLEAIREAAAHRFSFDDRSLLQYGDIPGYKSFREAVAKFLSGQQEYKGPVDSNSLFITNGITGGLILICTFFTQAGDVVYAEDPSYFLAINTFKDFNLRTDSLPTDEHGLDVVYLEKKLRAAPPVLWPKFVYTIPTFNNPAGVTLPDDRRKKLVELSEEFGFLVVADEVYQLLGYGNSIIPQQMFSYDRKGTVVSLGSFSKILAPALRVGWLQASPAILAKIADSGQFDSSGGINPIMFAITHSALELGLQEKHLASVRKTLRENAISLGDALRKHLPPFLTFRQPDGGYFVWVKCPAHWDAEALWSIARNNHKVQFQPGVKFSATKQLRNYIRLSVAFYDKEELEEGALRLGEAAREYAQVVGEVGRPRSNSGSPSVVRVAVHGATGKLGSLIVALLTQPNADGATYAGSIGLTSVCPLYAGSVGRGGEVPPCDVVIDASTAEGTKSLIPRLTNQKLIVGTTGDLPYKELTEYSARNTVAIVPNFSAGIPLMLNLIKMSMEQLPSTNWAAEIIDAHHTAKRDAPSGTAKRLAEQIGDVPIHSIRLGDTLGEHTVWFAGTGERLELKHVATKREVFAIGALRIARWIFTQNAGLFHK